MELVKIIAGKKAKGLKAGETYLATKESAESLRQKGWLAESDIEEEEKPKRGRKSKTAE